jgi:molybdopterin-guanine dinucleotide biosynthesis protein A
VDAVGVVLAGGESRRFRSQPKALASLGGVPLIEHVIERLYPQVSSMAISVEKRNPLFNTFDLDQIEDPEPGVQGPLPALLASLRWAKDEAGSQWLQTAPCDTPFLPKDLVGRLGLHVGTKQAAACVPRFRGDLHPTCGLWNVSILEAVEEAVGDGLRGFKEFFDTHPVATLDWPEPFAGAPDPFFNVNSPTQLQLAERSL